ncbi:uncharacterized protein Z518_04692 [Rhinocladiella mackenziei CBS 650.93]|uniref:FAD/NAD(P)-binding domain-containing protein n=1 Tax=Rhinocladiella mackenziei CBS 650.93 TaxID=1442369 RepID=A0A0D2IU75_9EURO|nr:uncharacterized protein Z518_04692 [Rhinocladiella mackenziei CBS 650.93]KIX06716.1 hypothetical protein Z518_04692 [Rhinocladiella mackenziei CBS 650.93]
MGSVVNCDVLIVGAGFSGMYGLYRLRKLGLKVKAFEAGSDFGGVWYWNRYPGARVDSEWPFYQLSLPEVWKDWNFTERFPDHNEIRAYFHHVDKVLDLRKDIEFDARVNSCVWDGTEGRWTVKTVAGHLAMCKYLFLCTGLLYQRHYPDFPGFEKYKGVVHHSGFWPDHLDMTGKKVAVIGAGATSVQIVQDLTKVASQLDMYMRRPSLCLPMAQRDISEAEQDCLKPYYGTLFKQGRKSAGGYPRYPPDCSIFDVSDQEREDYYEHLWKAGSFGFGASNYKEIWVDLKANRLAYDFWAKKTRARISDPKKRDLMAPLEPPYPILTKRSPLEQDYYETLDSNHVEIVDLKTTPIKTFSENGIVTADGKEREYDYVILATGFDSFTGSVSNMGLKSRDGEDIKDLWSKTGISTYLGIMIRGFPNCFMVYSPQAPTALSNGPTILECQVDWVVDAIEKLEKEGVKSIEPKQEAQDAWGEMITSMSQQTLFPLTNSWWTGGNIPGKKVQMLTYTRGIGEYEPQCRETLDSWKGFEVASA